MNTNEFEANLKKSFPTIEGVEFYQNSAAQDAEFPYVVARFESVVDTEPTYLINLVFSCYDQQDNTSQKIKNIADSIQKVFNKKVLNYENMSVHSTLTIRQEIPSEMLTEKQCTELQFDLVLYQNKEVI